MYIYTYSINVGMANSRCVALGFLLSAKHLCTTLTSVWLSHTCFGVGMAIAIPAIPLPPPLYSSHSLRIGAATEAATVGLPNWLIQQAGRWKSSAYERYIRSPPNALLKVAPALARTTDTRLGVSGIVLLGKFVGGHRH